MRTDYEIFSKITYVCLNVTYKNTNTDRSLMFSDDLLIKSQDIFLWIYFYSIVHRFVITISNKNSLRKKIENVTEMTGELDALCPQCMKKKGKIIPGLEACIHILSLGGVSLLPIQFDFWRFRDFRPERNHRVTVKLQSLIPLTDSVTCI